MSQGTVPPTTPAAGVIAGIPAINFRAHEVRANSQGGREDFEQMVAQLVRAVNPGVKAMVVAANPGDWGIDVFVGDLDGVVTVWQSKYFMPAVSGSGHQAQIRESFKSAVENAAARGFRLDRWILSVPSSLDGPTAKWWAAWKKRSEKAHNLVIDLWDETELRGMLMSSDADAVRRSYYEPARVRDSAGDAADAAAAVVDLGRPEDARTVQARRSGNVIRVRDAVPRRLGVHASIRVDDAPGDVPIYVTRDIDKRLCALLNACDRGAFVLLVGGSSTGKTRSLYEAVCATLSESWLVVPDSTGELTALVDSASPDMVIWLDELQNYLTGEHHLTPRIVRDLLAAGAVLVGTMWPEDYIVRAAHPIDGNYDQYAADRELLTIADVLDVADELSPGELARAHDLALGDGRLAAALASSDGGMIQVLAAGPQLVRWWLQSPTPYGRALITVAVDARRLGVTSALSVACLRAAMPSYLTPTERATAPTDWFDQGLAYATTSLHGATSVLSPVDTGEMGSLAGYRIADYLFQYGRATRRTECPPDSFWQAFAEYHDHLADLTRLGYSAESRLRIAFATLLYRRCLDGGENSVLLRLVNLLMGQRQTDDAVDLLRRHAVDARSHGQLIRLLAEQGNITALRAEADSRDWLARGWLVEVLARQRNTSELSERAHAGDLLAKGRLADLEQAPEHLEDLQSRAAAGDQFAAGHLAAIETDDEHVGSRRARSAIDPGGSDRSDGQNVDVFSPAIFTNEQMCRFVDVLVIEGAISDATVFLQACVSALIDNADDLLAHLLAESEEFDDLEKVAATGEWSSNYRLADLLVESGQVDALQAAAAAGNTFAAWKVAELLVDRGDVDEAIAYLTDLADAGDGLAEIRLTEILATHDRAEELESRAADSLWNTGSWIGYLVDRGRFNEAIGFLRSRVDKGDNLAASQLGDLLAGQGRVDDAIAVLVPFTFGREYYDGDGPSANTLLEILANHRRVDTLRQEVNAGTAHASDRWIRLLQSIGTITTGDADHLRRFGLNADGSAV